MKELIGFNIIEFAITLLITLVMGGDLDTKDKLLLITGEPIILGIDVLVDVLQFLFLLCLI